MILNVLYGFNAILSSAAAGVFSSLGNQRSKVVGSQFFCLRQWVGLDCASRIIDHADLELYEETVVWIC
ncbi:hypothetical protein [Pedobacter nototheniae]|uniref:hypothetical protein n=1 Tax=Pedobacter nototheniae TaxID=2488994 RepID=UPI00103AD733|nr:hypothetical protein [Pedobacter nototheniae]